MQILTEIIEWLVTIIAVIIGVAILSIIELLIIEYPIQSLIIFGLLMIYVFCLWVCYNVTR